MPLANNPIKLCIVAQSHYANDPRVRREAETAAASGMEVDVISLRARAQKMKRELNGVNVYGIPLMKKRGGLGRYLFEYLVFGVSALVVLTVFHIRRRYRLVQIHTLPDVLIFCAIVPRLMGAKVVLDMHEVMPEFFISKFKVRKDHLFIRALLFLERASVKFADHVITVNDPIQQLLIDRGVPSEKITVVMNSVDENLFAAARQSRAKARSGYKIMYHGTLTDIYGLDIAIRALPYVKEHVPDMTFHIFGDGPLRADLDLLIRKLNLTENVFFRGSIPLEDIPGQLVDCDLGLLPTRQDEFLDLSFSNKLVEYVYMGKPVVSSRLKTTTRYFRESSISYFTPHDHVALANCIVALYRDSQKSSDQVQSALQDYQNISWPVMRHRYLSLFKRLAVSPG